MTTKKKKKEEKEPCSFDYAGFTPHLKEEFYEYVFTNPSPMSRMWHKVNFLCRVNRFEFRVFF